MTSPSTPYLAVDPAALDANIASMAVRAADLGIALRPHAKTHKCVEIARRQLEAGAVGLTVATVGEAEVFDDAGVDDLFLAYIAGMDAFAKGLRIAASLLESGEIEEFVEKRYGSFASGIGKRILDGTAGFEELEAYALANGPVENTSGRQELLESILNRYVLNSGAR